MAVSAQYSVTIRVELDARQEPLGKLTAAIAEAGGQLQGVDLVPGAGAGGQTGARVHDRRPGPRALGEDPAGDRLDPRRPRPRLRRPHDADAPRRQDRHAQQVPAENPRRPLDGLHARRRPRLHGHPPRPRQGLRVHDQEEHGRGRLRRQRRARARQHRPRGGDAGDGGQVHAVQRVRRGRRLPDLPRHPGRRRDRQGGRADGADLRRHQPRGHLRPALLRDRGPAEGVARHPRLPRRPARHRGGDDGGAVQRAEDHRQADRGAAGAGGRPRRRRGSGDEDDARLRDHPDRRLRPQGRALDRARGLRVGRDERGQALVRGELEPGADPGPARRRDRGHGPLRRPLRPRDHPSPSRWAR